MIHDLSLHDAESERRWRWLNLLNLSLSQNLAGMSDKWFLLLPLWTCLNIPIYLSAPTFTANSFSEHESCLPQHTARKFKNLQKHFASEITKANTKSTQHYEIRNVFLNPLVLLYSFQGLSWFMGAEILPTLLVCFAEHKQVSVGQQHYILPP